MTNRVILADSRQVEANYTAVQMVLDALGKVFDEPSYTRALVSDQSLLSDFNVEDDDFHSISTELGIDMNNRNDDDWYIYKLANKLVAAGKVTREPYERR